MGLKHIETSKISVDACNTLVKRFKALTLCQLFLPDCKPPSTHSADRCCRCQCPCFNGFWHLTSKATTAKSLPKFLLDGDEVPQAICLSLLGGSKFEIKDHIDDVIGEIDKVNVSFCQKHLGKPIILVGALY